MTAKIDLRILGASALLVQTDYDRATKDGDVLETAELAGATKQHLLELAGRDSELARKHHLYIDPVPEGLAFLPRTPRWNPLPDVDAELTHFRVHVLDVLDVVVSKLKRWWATDRQDIDAMVQRGLVDHAKLVDRFRSAADRLADGAEARCLPDCLENLHTVERDMLVVDETPIELSSWVYED